MTGRVTWNGSSGTTMMAAVSCDSLCEVRIQCDFGRETSCTE